jgi:hypothetical protein
MVTVGTNGHARPEQVQRILSLIEKNLDRDPLNHCHVMARGIFRRQQAVSRTAGGGDAIDVTVVLGRMCPRRPWRAVQGASLSAVSL